MDEIILMYCCKVIVKGYLSDDISLILMNKLFLKEIIYVYFGKNKSLENVYWVWFDSFENVVLIIGNIVRDFC